MYFLASDLGFCLTVMTKRASNIERRNSSSVTKDGVLSSIDNADQFSHSNIGINDNITFETTSNIIYKRKEAPTKIVNRKKIKKTSNNTASTLTLSSITNNSDINDIDTTDVEQPIQPSTVWQYAVRDDNKTHAICLLCDKEITTNNWSTSSIRRHLVKVHQKTELILGMYFIDQCFIMGDQYF